MARRTTPKTLATPDAPEAWSELYRRAAEVRQLAPWTELLEDELFALEDPDTQQLTFVSIMGAMGQHLAVAVYLGLPALRHFQRIHAGQAGEEDILEVRHLQVSWEDRATLRPEDLEQIRGLGLKFRGRQAWPMFRSYQAGYFPWFFTPAEVTLLTHVLGQVPAIVARRAQDPELLRSAFDGSFLLRTATRQGDGWHWSDGRFQLPPSTEPPPPAPVPFQDQLTLKRLGQLRRVPATLELDWFPLLQAIQDHPGERPRRGYLLLMAESQRGLLLGQQLLVAEPSWEAMLDTAPRWLAERFMQLGCLPKELRVRAPRLFHQLFPLASALNIRILQTDDVPVLAAARAELERMF